jgi:3D (Asp-Asp-Asp) domain-containing protein
MNPLLSTALMGLFAFSGSTGSMVNATSAVQVPSVAPLAIQSTKSYTVSMTAYNAVEGQTDGDPYTTAAGVYSNPDVVVARSQDLAMQLPFGTVIRVMGPSGQSPSCGYDAVDDQIGYRIIADTMNVRMHNKIDILLDQKKKVAVGGGRVINPSLALGICDGVTIQVVGHIDISHMPKNQEELAEMLAGTHVGSEVAMR